jgi:acetylornithine/succinyldiaminopimelate/putrescine aminotransferase
MLGFELAPDIPAFAGTGKAASLQFVARLHEAGVLAIPAGTQVVRLLPALNLSQTEALEAIGLIERVAKSVAGA